MLRTMIAITIACLALEACGGPPRDPVTLAPRTILPVEPSVDRVFCIAFGWTVIGVDSISIAERPVLRKATPSSPSIVTTGWQTYIEAGADPRCPHYAADATGDAK